MNLKDILTLGIFVFFVLPGLAGIMFWLLTYNVHSPEENIKTGTELLVDQAMPWWLGLVSFAATLGSFGIVILLFVAAVIKITGIKS